MQEIVVDSARLHDFARVLCEKAGLRSEDAAQMATLQVQTDLRGVSIHTAHVPCRGTSTLSLKVR